MRHQLGSGPASASAAVGDGDGDGTGASDTPPDSDALCAMGGKLSETQIRLAVAMRSRHGGAR